MVEKIVSLIELCPSDLPSKEALKYYSLIGIGEKNERDGIPQVWEIDGELVVSDGNKRVYHLFSEGHSEVLIDYQGKVNPSYAFIMEEVFQRREELRNRGIFSFKDITDEDIV